MWPLKLIVLEKQALFWGSEQNIYGASEDIGGKIFIFQLNLGMWPLKSIISVKRALWQGFQHTFMGFTRT